MSVERIAHKHCALGVMPQDYLIVHDNLMEAIGEVLGGAVTPEVAAAWSEAVMALAKFFIQTETSLYEEASIKQWTGPRDFVISEIIKETDQVKSFRMVAKDGKGTCHFEPGQYISVYEKPLGKTYFAPRHYTVTSQPGEEYYQITVKKAVDPSAPDDTHKKGQMSHFLHSKNVGDTVQLGPVFGPRPFGVPSPEDNHRVACFITVGVGITPTIAMLPSAIRDRPRVAVFHADQSPTNCAFNRYLEETVPNCGGILNISYSQPSQHESPYSSKGRLTAAKVIEKLRNEGIEVTENVDYFICAGNTASPLIYKELVATGVNNNRLHLEYFGPFVSVPAEENNENGVDANAGLARPPENISKCPFHHTA